MASRKLLYFNFNGYGEALRYLLHYGGLEFEDERVNVLEWPIMEIKESLPFGQMPLYTENGRTLSQSMAIARYIASQVPGLLPSDPWEQAQLDATAHNVYDLVKKLFPCVCEQDPEKREANIKFFYESVAFFFSRFEKELKANNGFFNGKLSWADFILAAANETLNFFFQETFQKDYPTIAALGDKIRDLPGVKEYVATRPTYERNFLHKYQHYRP